MRLHDLMRDELVDVRADAEAITSRAVTARAHRRLAWAASGVAAAAIVGLGAWALTGHDTSNRAIDPADGSSTVPATPRVVAGALATAVDDGSLGDLGTPTSWAGLDASPAGYGAVASWGRSGGSDSGESGTVRLYVFHPDAAARALLGLSASASTAPLDLGALCSEVTAPATCHHDNLPDGDSVLTIDATAPSDSSSSVDIPTTMVALSSPRRDIVVFAVGQAVSTSISWTPPATDRLVALVEQPWWGWNLPSSDASAGAALPNYTQQRLSPGQLGGTSSSSSGSGSAAPEPSAAVSASGSAVAGEVNGSASSAASSSSAAPAGAP